MQGAEEQEGEETDDGDDEAAEGEAEPEAGGAGGVGAVEGEVGGGGAFQDGKQEDELSTQKRTGGEEARVNVGELGEEGADRGEAEEEAVEGRGVDAGGGACAVGMPVAGADVIGRG